MVRWRARLRLQRPQETPDLGGDELARREQRMHVERSQTWSGRTRRSNPVFRLRTLTPVLPHLRMLLSLDGYSADGRRVRGFVNDRWIGGTGDVAEASA